MFPDLWSMDHLVVHAYSQVVHERSFHENELFAINNFAAIERKFMYFVYLPEGPLDVDLHLLENLVGWVRKGPCKLTVLYRT